MSGFDSQKEDVVKNSEYMSEIHGEFQKIVDAVMDNKEIVDELERIIGQFKIWLVFAFKYVLCRRNVYLS